MCRCKNEGVKAEAGSWAHGGDGGQSEGCVAPRCVSCEVCGAIWDAAECGASLALRGKREVLELTSISA